MKFGRHLEHAVEAARRGARPGAGRARRVARQLAHDAAESRRRAQLLAAHASSETADVLARCRRSMRAAEAASRATALAAGRRVGPYRLKREIGRGGMADVWLAERADGAFKREVALKLPLSAGCGAIWRQRFARERDILARLEHPHIARLVRRRRHRRRPAVSGDGVRRRPADHAILRYSTGSTSRRAWGCSLQVLDAVQFAHANLVIHRDLKPSNILVTGDGAGAAARLRHRQAAGRRRHARMRRS